MTAPQETLSGPAPVRRRGWRKPAVLALALLAVGVAALGFVVLRHYRVAGHMFDPQPQSPLLKEPPATLVPGASNVGFDAEPGVRLAAWYVPPRNGATIVVMHGSNDDRASMLPEIRLLAGAGFGVLAYDAPGCGESGGNLHWGPQAEAAAHAAVRWLRAQPAPRPVRIGALGLSMGGYILAQAAARDPAIAAVVLEGTPPTFPAMTLYAHRKWGALSQVPAMWGLRRSPELLARPTAEAAIGRLAPRPVLVIGGGRDLDVPPFLAQRLFDHAGPPKELWIATASDHSGFIKDYPREYPARLIAFFTKSLLPGGASRP